MEKTENHGFSIVPKQEHITFPLLNVIMDIINSNFLLLDSLLKQENKNLDSENNSSKIELEKTLEALHSDMTLIEEQLALLKKSDEETKTVIATHTNIMNQLAEDISQIPDIYAKKDYTYDTITIDRIVHSVHCLKRTMAKIVHNINILLLELGENTEKDDSTYTKEEINKKLQLLESQLIPLIDLKEYFISMESNHRDLQDKISNLEKIMDSIGDEK